MRKQIILLIALLTFSNLIFGQKSEKELKEYKQFLPYIIKGLKDSKENFSTEKIDQRTVGLFQKPWLTKKIEKEIAEDILNSIIDNKSYNIEKDYREKWNLNFSSQINANKVIRDVYNSNTLLANLFITISDIEFVDANKISIIDTVERKIQINQSRKLHFQTGGVQSSFPLKKEYGNVSGSMNLTLTEYQTISYKEFNSSNENETFDLGNEKELKLLKIENNKAYFYLPKLIDNIKISTTNKKGEEYGENAKMQIPKTIFDYGTGENMTESNTKSIIDNLTLKDINEKPQILLYETNGTIENLYIYLKTNPKELISKRVEIKL
ncbi:hypothetical protein JoomaDRAFT_3398 [Galbibacter orientalis DSM 19592]|uniref:Uncharacterized protein n=1 Tax=Galbibacter orientalis DSM 19592 TaxID=926559 RepID=I3C9P8_9FLAO|nr:hypothetical protein [Galbibacter orientalis]EIJ40341.1 hypothetical protein JoomaDRAFT_3398 [Galbibacter orientalis DSM 19592]